jgi:hypothetical protein
LFEFLIATQFHFRGAHSLRVMVGDVFTAPHLQLRLIM